MMLKLLYSRRNEVAWQRVGRSSTTPDVDGDQSRVRFGLQFGYPLAFDMPW